jgi:hypothetical protein
MVRAVAAFSCTRQHPSGRGGRVRKRPVATQLVFGLVVAFGPGCAIAPRARMDECQRLTQTLRSENARMKDRYLALRGQNRDYAERAVDDAKRLAVQDEAIERLEHSVQAYQDERTRLEAAYQQLASSLGVADPSGDGGQTQARSNPTTPDASNPPATARRSKSASVNDDDTPR